MPLNIIIDGLEDHIARVVREEVVSALGASACRCGWRYEGAAREAIAAFRAHTCSPAA